MHIQTSINEPVHVKVSLNGEFRRFLLTEFNYDKLEATVKSLFCIESAVSLRFQDDEKDWVHVSSDEELAYAIDLSGKLLRLEVKTDTQTTSPSVTPPSVVPDQTEVPWRRGGRGGKGRGGWRNPDRLEVVEARMASKIQSMEEKLNSGQLTSERERTVRWKLARTQEKLEHVKAERERIATAPECNETEDKDHVEGWGGWGRRGGRGGRGRGGWRNEEGCPRGGKLQRLLPPEILENFHRTKAALRDAKETGNHEEIDACKTAFLAAKNAKLAAMAALRAQGEGQETPAGF